MALSLGGRKLLVEVAGCTAALIIGAVALTHYQQTRQIFAKLAGLKSATVASQERGVAAQAQERPAVNGRRTAELVAQRNGHFFADAEINGRAVNVMVDTGASMVALTYEDARRAGVVPRDSDFTQQANTANGIARFAPIEIDRLAIGSVEVRNVRAAVMEEGKLDTTLLGMSFLSKLSRVDMQSGRLVLEE